MLLQFPIGAKIGLVFWYIFFNILFTGAQTDCVIVLWIHPQHLQQFKILVKASKPRIFILQFITYLARIDCFYICWKTLRAGSEKAPFHSSFLWIQSQKTLAWKIVLTVAAKSACDMEPILELDTHWKRRWKKAVALMNACNWCHKSWVVYALLRQC